MTFYVFFWNNVSKGRKKSHKKYQVRWMSIEILVSKLPNVMGTYSHLSHTVLSCIVSCVRTSEQDVWCWWPWNYTQAYDFTFFNVLFEIQKTWLFTFFWVVAHVFSNTGVGGWKLYCRVPTGVNAAGDAGDTSPPIFWLAGTSMGISPPLLLRTFGYSRPILVVLTQWQHSNPTEGAHDKENFKFSTLEFTKIYAIFRSQNKKKLPLPDSCPVERGVSNGEGNTPPHTHPPPSALRPPPNFELALTPLRVPIGRLLRHLLWDKALVAYWWQIDKCAEECHLSYNTRGCRVSFSCVGLGWCYS